MFQALTKLAHFGITLSTSSKLRLQDEAAVASKEKIVQMLKENPMPKITGDNLDVYIRKDIVTSTKKNLDLHLFASNIIFPRLANESISNIPPNIPEITPDNISWNRQQKANIVNSYKV